MPSSSTSIGIIGAGRFGTYYGRQLERVGWHVQLADVKSPPTEYRDALARACASSTVIYAVPIRSLQDVILETRHLLDPAAVVMDVCSVKMIPCASLERLLPGRATVGTHPLFGAQSAPVSCAGQRIALCSPPAMVGSDAGATAMVRAEELSAALGLVAIQCTPREHDTQVARSQFLTHFIGRGASRAGIGRLALSTKTHDDLMDIIDVVCHDSTELFEDMAAFNPMVADVRAAFLGALAAIDRQLARREHGLGELDAANHPSTGNGPATGPARG